MNDPTTQAGRALLAILTQPHKGPYAEAPLLHSGLENRITDIEAEAREQERDQIRERLERERTFADPDLWDTFLNIVEDRT